MKVLVWVLSSWIQRARERVGFNAIRAFVLFKGLGVALDF